MREMGCSTLAHNETLAPAIPSAEQARTVMRPADEGERRQQTAKLYRIDTTIARRPAERPRIMLPLNAIMGSI